MCCFTAALHGAVCLSSPHVVLSRDHPLQQWCCRKSVCSFVGWEEWAGCACALIQCLKSPGPITPHVTMGPSDQCPGKSSPWMVDGRYGTFPTQDSIVLVVFDARATSVPNWLAASGFTLWEGVEVAGAEYRLPYVYKVCVTKPWFSRGAGVRCSERLSGAWSSHGVCIKRLPFCRACPKRLLAHGLLGVSLSSSTGFEWLRLCCPPIRPT